MAWAFVAVVSAGLLLGLRYRVPALSAASVVTAAACLWIAISNELRPTSAVLITFAMLGVFQVAYIAGVMLSCAVARAGVWPVRFAFFTNGGRSVLGGPRDAQEPDATEAGVRFESAKTESRFNGARKQSKIEHSGKTNARAAET